MRAGTTKALLARATALTLTALAAMTACAEAANLSVLAERFRSTEERQPVRVLVVTTTHGYRHDAAIDASRALLDALEPVTEFSFSFLEDLTAFDADVLGAHDVLFFNNSTLRAASAAGPTLGWQGREVDQPLQPAQQQAIIGFLQAGGGVVSAHAGLDALYAWPEYRALLGGGLFREHPWTEPVSIVVEDQSHPITAGLGDREVGNADVSHFAGGLDGEKRLH